MSPQTSLRLHYAYTLRAWRERFMAIGRMRGSSTTSASHVGVLSRILRSGFRFQDAVVFQVQIARRNDTVPLTRGYIAAREIALKVMGRS